MSHRSVIYYVDLNVREGMTLEQAITEARETDAKRKASGYDQNALDEAARIGFGNAAFETNEDEVPEILEEFYPETDSMEQADARTAVIASSKTKPSLKEKLDNKAVGIEASAA